MFVVLEKLRAVYGDELPDKLNAPSDLRHALPGSDGKDDVWKNEKFFELTDVMARLAGTLLGVVEDLLDYHLQAEGSGAEPRSDKGA